MLQTRSWLAAGAWRRVLGRALSTLSKDSDLSSRDALDAALGGDTAVLQSTKRRDRRLHYLVMQHRPALALELLEHSVLRSPIPIRDATGERGVTKFLKLPPATVCNKVLNASAQDPGLVAKAAELADALALQGVALEARTLQTLLIGLARQGGVVQALPLLDMWLLQQAEALEDDENTRAPLQVLTLLMEAAARVENTHLVLQVLARMASVGLMPTAQSMTSLLHCFARLGQHEVGISILDWMERGGLAPNVYSYTALLALPAQVHDADLPALLAHTQRLRVRMAEGGVRPNARFYAQLLHMLARTRDSAEAQAAWQDMRAAGVEPDLILYSTMIDACAKCRDSGAALAVYEEMVAAGVVPDVVAYTSLLSALRGTAGAAGRARALWAGMRQAGVRPNGRAVAAYLDLLLVEGETDEALRLLTDAAALLGSDRSSSVSTSTSTSSASSTSRRSGSGADAANAGSIAPSIPGSADTSAMVPPSPVIDLPRIYEHFIHVLSSRGQHHLVEHLARHRKAARLPLTLGIACALLTAQAARRGGLTAKWLLQEEEWRPEVSLQEQAGIRARRQAAVEVPEGVVEACLLGRGSPEVEAKRIMCWNWGTVADSVASSSSNARAGGAGRSDTPTAAASSSSSSSSSSMPSSPTAFNMVLGGLAVQGAAGAAFELYDWLQQHRPQRWRPDWWTYRLLMFAALNASDKSQTPNRVASVLADSRHHARMARRRGSAGSQDWWDLKTRAAVLAALQQSEEVAGLLGGAQPGTGDRTAAQEREEQLAQLRMLLGQRPA